MAYIKIIPIKVTVGKALSYIMKAEKTDDKLLISSFGCSPETAELEFAFTRVEGKNNVMDKGDNLAFHLIQSFRPGEIDAVRAHELGKKFADAALKGKYEYVLSTHVDKGHIHNHIIFNATSFTDYHKYVSNRQTHLRLCRISNRICREYGLDQSLPTGEKGRSYKENMEYHRGTSWKAKLKAAVDKAIWSSINYEEFLQKMKLAGYEIRQGKNLAFRAPDQKNFTNMKTLGNYYSEENVRRRLEQNRHKTKMPRRLSREVRVFVEISSFVAAEDQPGFEKWAKLNNLKEAAKTFNYLSEHNLLNYEQFEAHTQDLAQALTAAGERMKEIDKSISDTEQLQKKCRTYRACRSIVEGEKSQFDKAAYRVTHKNEYALHQALRQELLAMGYQKIPSDQKLAKTLEQLNDEKSALLLEQKSLQKQSAVLSVVRQNIESMLKPERSEPGLRDAAERNSHQELR